MDNKCIFNCEVCGQQKTVEDTSSTVPQCCDRPMVKAEKLPVCETTETAEHSRLDQTGEPCDDGRGAAE
jgi:hypothetical protein